MDNNKTVKLSVMTDSAHSRQLKLVRTYNNINTVETGKYGKYMRLSKIIDGADLIVATVPTETYLIDIEYKGEE